MKNQKVTKGEPERNFARKDEANSQKVPKMLHEREQVKQELAGKNVEIKPENPQSETQKKRTEIYGNPSKKEKEMQESDLFEEV